MRVAGGRSYRCSFETFLEVADSGCDNKRPNFWDYDTIAKSSDFDPNARVGVAEQAIGKDACKEGKGRAARQAAPGARPLGQRGALL